MDDVEQGGSQVVALTTNAAARAHLLEWLQIERETYADVEKYSDEHATRQAQVKELVEQGFVLDGMWDHFFMSYYQRMLTSMFDIRTPKGRQAAGKLVVALMHMLETSIEHCGPMPQPGISSSEGAPAWVTS